MYVYLVAYTSGSPQDLDQQNAIYRRQLIEVYGTVAEAGGFFGWGLAFPRIGYQDSIDNEYLFLHLTQGILGLVSFFLIALESCLALIVQARRSQQKSDFAFCLTLVAVLCGILLTIVSVGLTAQAQELYFLCVGWSLSVRQRKMAVSTVQPASQAEFRFQRTFA